ncbi:MAG TPA: ankyrin repeat domain-containing protein [Xanthomonadaceae bacterium]|nr:ankyrin repeat domain-containing protein [Xanthomonadaceae bacterium]
MAMPERPARQPLRATLALLGGIGLSLLPLLSNANWWLIGPWLAQPLFALATAWWLGSRPAGEETGRWLPDAVALALLWGAAALLDVLAMAWPLPMLLHDGGLNAALGTSAGIGIALIMLWRYWPVFARAERNGGGLAGFREAANHDGDAATLPGLVIALAIAAILALVLCAGWTGIVATSQSRILLLIAQAVIAPLLHAAIHRLGREMPRGAHAEAAAVRIAAQPAPLKFEFEDIGDPNLRIYAAARAGRADEARVALTRGADPKRLPDADDRDQRSLPVLAAVIGDLSLLRELIGRGVDLNYMHAGLTPLLAATRDSWHGRIEAVTILLANGADARVADADGNTPLHHAARSSDAGVAARLLDAHAPIDALNAEGFNPLGVACEAGNWRLARFLLDHGARCEPDQGQPALLAAASGDDDAAGVQLLLKHKARVDARGSDQSTALMLACEANNAEVVGVLLDAGAAVDARDDAGMTALMHAAHGGSEAVLQRLAKARPDPALVDNEGRNALAIACASEHAEPSLVHALVGLGVDPQRASNDGRRALDHALAAGRWRLVAELDPTHPLPESVAEDLAAGSNQRGTAELLRDALAARSFERAVPLLKLGDAVALATAQLREFALESDLDVFAWLLAHGANAEAREPGHDNVLFALLDRGGSATGALQCLLDRAVSPAGAGGLARYLHACALGEASSLAQEQLALNLCERGADPFVASAGSPPLHLAVRLGWVRLAERLLACGVAPDARDARGITALQLACTLGRESAVRLLVRAGASPELRTPNGETALGIALAADRSDLVAWLDWRGWRLPLRPLQPTDLPAAAMVGDAGAVRRLLDLGLPINTVDSQGCTALLRAAGGGQLVVVGMLLQRGADSTIAAATGATALTAAVSMRHPQIVEMLLAQGADVDRTLPGGITPLMLAAALGLPEMVSRLLTHGADLQRRDDRGLGVLHCAANYAFQAHDRQRVLALLDEVLLSGAEADTPSHNGQTPLLLLLGAGHEPGATCDEGIVIDAMEYLLNENVSFEARDHRGFTPMHLAALHGLGRVVQRLIAAGAERRPHDILGRTPYDIALLRGYVDIAAEFEPLRSSAPPIARFLRKE